MGRDTTPSSTPVAPSPRIPSPTGSGRAGELSLQSSLVTAAAPVVAEAVDFRPDARRRGTSPDRTTSACSSGSSWREVVTDVSKLSRPAGEASSASVAVEVEVGSSCETATEPPKGRFEVSKDESARPKESLPAGRTSVGESISPSGIVDCAFRGYIGQFRFFRKVRKRNSRSPLARHSPTLAAASHQSLQRCDRPIDVRGRRSSSEASPTRRVRPAAHDRRRD